ncbi:MAG TPA: hypothetical protein V6C50_13420 [Crinalium sp.]
MEKGQPTFLLVENLRQQTKSTTMCLLLQLPQVSEPSKSAKNYPFFTTRSLSRETSSDHDRSTTLSQLELKYSSSYDSRFASCTNDDRASITADRDLGSFA